MHLMTAIYKMPSVQRPIIRIRARDGGHMRLSPYTLSITMLAAESTTPAICAGVSFSLNSTQE